MKSNEKNIIWNPKGESVNYGFRCINTPDHLGIVVGKNKTLYTINIEDEKKKLYDGKACFYTDGFYSYPKWFYTEIYGENQINIPLNHTFNDGSRRFATLGEMLNKIRKVEHLFPENTEFELENGFYGHKGDKDYSLGLKYITKRKFKGFKTEFQVSKLEFHDNFQKDELKAKFISFLRENGFLVKMEMVEYHEYCDDIKDCKIAFIYGYGLMAGLSEFDNSIYDYSYGKKSILYDRLGEFNKWSTCNEISKPTSEKDFADILKTLIDHGKKESL